MNFDTGDMKIYNESIIKKDCKCYYCDNTIKKSEKKITYNNLSVCEKCYIRYKIIIDIGVNNEK